MGGKLTVTFDSPETAAQLVQRFSRSSAGKRVVMRELGNYINGLQGGVRRAHVRVQCFEAFASQIVTCSRAAAVDGTDELTIGTIVLAVEASPATESEFAKGASDITMAANLAACINAHSVLSLFVKAASDGVSAVTITCLYGGPVGDAIVLAETGDGFTLGGTALDGGDQTLDESQTFAFGYSG
jgi:hypothetical protein